MNPQEYEALQHSKCSNSRKRPDLVIPDRMGQRLVNNIQDAIKVFEPYKGTTILDIGCGDGLGMQVFENAGFRMVGLEVDSVRVATALSHGLNVHHAIAEDLDKVMLVGEEVPEVNIFTSHCLEHTQDLPKVMKLLQKYAKNLIYILVPIEWGGKSGNAAHCSPIRSLEWLKTFVEETWEVVHREYRSNLEPEGLLVLKRK